MRVFLRINLFWILTAFLGDVVVGPLMSIAGIAPDFPLIALVFLALAAGSYPATVAGFLIGLIADLTNPALLGVQALLDSCLGFGLGRLRRRLAYGMPLVEAMVVALAVLAHDLVYLLVASGGGGDSFPLRFITRSLPTAIYSGLLSIPVLRLAVGLGLLYRED
ncbi:rod shape-determining protein MreD [bacterium CG_4_9_14_3_um_filter_65_15]|nr:MAG: rod shape-determining protein MreD [bacterium CG_4_9_14_3_um_filter_65_15]